nr:MAG TPA: hypothetical protein [Caudoviricetes sp.]
MATGNFFNANCTRYFVLGMNKYYTKEDVEANEMAPELVGEFDEVQTEFDYQTEKENIVSELQKKGWDDFDGYEGEAQVIAYKNKTLVYGGCEISLEIKALVRSGYYEGACMDLSGKVTIDSAGDYWTGSPEYDMFDDGEFSEISVVDDNWTGNPGLDHLQAKNIINKLDSIIEDLKIEAEYAFSRGCEREMFQAYHCSNGETGYFNIQKKLYQEMDEENQDKAA